MAPGTVADRAKDEVLELLHVEKGTMWAHCLVDMTVCVMAVDTEVCICALEGSEEYAHFGAALDLLSFHLHFKKPARKKYRKRK